MKRQRELIRAILQWLSDQPESWAAQPKTLDIYTEPAVVEYHFTLCEQAGFIRRGNPSHDVQLTWKGHEKLQELTPIK